uniref:Uncharacterized protein n=1 Tax=Triticum urartu TaxID=4572 RepID=A0A8R7Q4R0_TRIUA
MDLRRKWQWASETRRAISGRERPRPVSPATTGPRVLSTPAQRKSGSLATTAATSALERPRPERNARTALGLAGDLRWESLVEALSAWARVRPQVSTRYSSTANPRLGGMGAATAERRRRSGGVAGAEVDVEEKERRRETMRSRRRSIAAAAGGGSDGGGGGGILVWSV